MKLNPQTIGATLPNGFAGSYARQPDMILSTMPLGGDTQLPFGTPLKRVGNTVVALSTGDTAEHFAGIAARTFRSATSYLDQQSGCYEPGDAVPVLKRGSIQVRCQRGNPAPGGAVYLRNQPHGSDEKAAVGGLEAASEEGNVLLNGVQWGTAKDPNGVAELVLLNRQNV